MPGALTRIREFLPTLPKGRGDAVLQIGLFVLADLCYESVRGLAEGNLNEALANARTVIDVEASLGLFFERGLQQALIDTQWVIDIANFAYLNSHFIVTTSFLVWLYLYRNDYFYFVRNMFMIAMAMALVGYSLVPTAPPRLVPGLGIEDTLTQVSVNHESALVKLFVNPYAAIPSMHCAFSLMIGVSGALLARHSVSKALWCVYPLFVFFVVMVTGNHFWLDAAIGWAVAGGAALGAMQLAKARPAAWSWHPATA